MEGRAIGGEARESGEAPTSTVGSFPFSQTMSVSLMSVMDLAHAACVGSLRESRDTAPSEMLMVWLGIRLVKSLRYGG